MVTAYSFLKQCSANNALVKAATTDHVLVEAVTVESQSKHSHTYLYSSSLGPSLGAGVYVQVKNTFLHFSHHEPLIKKHERRSTSLEPVQQRSQLSYDKTKQNPSVANASQASVSSLPKISSLKNLSMLREMPSLRGMRLAPEMVSSHDSSDCGPTAVRSLSQPRGIRKASEPSTASTRTSSDGWSEASFESLSNGGCISSEETLELPKDVSAESSNSECDKEESVASPLEVCSPACQKTKSGKKQASKEKNKGKKNQVRLPIDGTGKVTTLMIRGIPCRLTQEHILSCLDEVGLAGTYDFFYAPRPVKSDSNLGYAFVNFIDEESAEKCTATLQGAPLQREARSKKLCTICPAHIQGLENLQASFRCASVPHRSSAPLFLQAARKEEC